MLVRFSAFTVSSTRRTASWAPGSAILRAASVEFDIGFLLGLILWHLVCQRKDCQDKPSFRNAENTGTLTFWHLVCQKTYAILLLQHVSQRRRRIVPARKQPKAPPAMADA